MKLKTLLIGASALAMLGATAVWAAETQAPGTEVRKEIITDDGKGGGKGEHCKVIMMHVGADDAMKAMHEHAGGVITREEFVEAHTKLFDKFDTNHDGKLDASEIEAAHHHMMEAHDLDCAHAEHMHEMMEMHGGDMHGGMHGDAHGEDGDHHHAIVLKIMHDLHDFDKLDTNHDGRISFEEFVAPLRQAFDAFDKDHSGYIEKGEWPHPGDHMEIHQEVHEDKQ